MHSQQDSGVSGAVSCSDYVPPTATEMSRISDGHKNLSIDSGEIVSESGTPLASNSLLGRGSQTAKRSAEISEIGSNNSLSSFIGLRTP